MVIKASLRRLPRVHLAEIPNRKRLGFRKLMVIQPDANSQPALFRQPLHLKVRTGFAGSSEAQTLKQTYDAVEPDHLGA